MPLPRAPFLLLPLLLPLFACSGSEDAGVDRDVSDGVLVAFPDTGDAAALPSDARSDAPRSDTARDAGPADARFDVPPDVVPPPPDAVADVAPDVPAPGPDAEPDTWVPEGRCLDDGVPAGDFWLADGRPAGQVAATAAFDGRGVWVAWNEPDGSGGYDVVAGRLGCDGGFLVPPFVVHETGHGNDFQPVVATSGGAVLVAWNAETGDDPNQAVYYRTFSHDGTPRMAEETVYVARQGGVAVPENGWMAAAAGLPDERFLIAAALGVNKAQRFQIVLQRLDAAGGAAEDSVYAQFRPVGTQLHPSLAAAVDGGAFVAWDESADFTTNEVRHARLAAGASTTTPFPAPVPPEGALAAYPDVAAAPGTSAYLSFHTETDDPDVVVVDAARLASEGPTLVLGERDRFDHSPRVAPTLGGGLVAWLTIRSGQRNDVRAQRFAYNAANGFTRIGGATLLNPGDARDAYSLGRPAVVHVGDGVFLIIWSEGAHPDQRLRARFLAP